MKRKISKLMTFVMALAMVLMMSVPSFAAVNPGNVTANAVNLDKYVVCEPDANIPAGTFTFEVAVPESDIAATATTLPVYKGVTANGYPKIGTDNTVSVAANATANTDNAKIALNDDTTTRKAAKVTFNIDFGSGSNAVQFTKPGVYRYYIKEKTPPSPFTIYNYTAKSDKESGSTVTESDTTTLDIYIQNGTGGLVYQGYVAYNGKVETAPAANETDANSKASGATKDAKHVNLTQTTYLQVEKVVAGNQGDKNEEFTFTINLTDLGNGTVIKVDSSNTATITSPTADTNGNITTTSGSVTITATVKDGQKVYLSGIPESAKYTAVEFDVTGTTTRTHNKGYVVTGEVTTSTDISTNGEVTITNTRQGNVPTGVLTKMVPGLVLIAIAALLLARRKLTGNK